MELSSRVEYAMISLLEMACQPNYDKPLQIRYIAEKHSIPERYLEQVFASLRRAGIIQSQRGSKGGYLLSRSPWQITLLDVFSCLEDAKSVKTKPENHSINRSVIQDIWKEAEQNSNHVLQRYTLRDLCQQIETRQQLNTMYYI
jgi:Rrf2 family protein